jgi:hypothetical protein
MTTQDTNPTPKSKQERKDEAWEEYEKIQKPALKEYKKIQQHAWEKFLKKRKEINEE